MAKINNGTLAYEMAKQLHEQYAINDNAKSSSVIGFLTAIAFIFAGFGYVFAIPYQSDKVVNPESYPCLLIMVEILVGTILTMFAFLCVNFGFSTRRDHIVISMIREDAGLKNGEWFSDGRDKCICNYLPGYYAILFWFIQIFIILIAVGVCLNTAISICECKLLAMAISIVFIVINLSYYRQVFFSYDNFRNKKVSDNQMN